MYEIITEYDQIQKRALWPTEAPQLAKHVESARSEDNCAHCPAGTLVVNVVIVRGLRPSLVNLSRIKHTYLRCRAHRYAYPLLLSPVSMIFSSLILRPLMQLQTKITYFALLATMLFVLGIHAHPAEPEPSTSPSSIPSKPSLVEVVQRELCLFSEDLGTEPDS